MNIIEKIEEIMDFGGTKKDILFLIVSAFALFISIFDLFSLPFDTAWIAIILCGIPIIIEAIIGLITKFDIKADVLVSLALIAAIFIGEDFAAGEVAFIMQLGAFLEDLTVSKARAGIERLVKLTPQEARLVCEDGEKMILADDVKKGDRLRVLSGETIPADGIILSGETSVNQAIMTGESLPVDKKVGDEVSSGTVNQFGVFEMEATRVGKDSSIQRMIQLVQLADADKAKIVGLADRWATWIVVAALVSAALTGIISGEIIRAVTILVVFCPCSLVLATPTAIMAATGNATKHGFLVKEGDALERLSKITKITFDKTGTLTYGKPDVIVVKSLSDKYSDNELYKITASAEQFSEHPLGKAIVHSYKKENSQFLDTNNFVMTAGKGITAFTDNKYVVAGNYEFIKSKDIVLSEFLYDETEKYLSEGCTVIYIAIDNEFIGYIVLTDKIRNESFNIINKIKSYGIKTVLLTGDNEKVANTTGNLLNIDEIHSSCLPEDKLNIIDKYQKNDNEYVCMIGDGVNDAPALKKAYIGIAMGGIGSDIAVDASDIVIAEDDVKELPHLISLSKNMMKTIKLNLIFSMTLNFIAIGLAITGILNPVIGALVHNAGSLIVIVNSAFLMKWK